MSGFPSLVGRIKANAFSSHLNLQKCVSIPCRQDQSVMSNSLKGQREMVSIPCRQDQSHYPHLSCRLSLSVSIPCRQDQSACRCRGFRFCESVSIPCRQDQSPLLSCNPLLSYECFHPLQVGSKQLFWRGISTAAQPCFHPLQVGSKHSLNPLWNPSMYCFHPLQVGSKPTFTDILVNSI